MYSFGRSYQPAIESIELTDSCKLLRVQVDRLHRAQYLTTDCTSLVPFSYEGSQNLHSVFVRSIGPAGWGDGDQLVAEVDKNVDQAPMPEVIGSCVSAPLNQGILLISPHHIVADENLRGSFSREPKRISRSKGNTSGAKHVIWTSCRLPRPQRVDILQIITSGL